LRLTDPVTGRPFPLPLPRSAFPWIADPGCATKLRRHGEVLLSRHLQKLYSRRLGASATAGAGAYGGYNAYNGYEGQDYASTLAQITQQQSQMYSNIFSNMAQQQQQMYGNLFSNIAQQQQQVYGNTFSNPLFGGTGGGMGGMVTNLLSGAIGSGGGPISSLLGTATQVFMGGGLF
jgi:hypothetical protein